GHTRGDEILHHFVLPVNRDAAAGQGGEIDPMAFAEDIKEDTVMEQAFAFQAITDTAFNQEIDRTLLQHSGAHPLNDVVTGPVLYDDGIDPRQIQEVPQHQTCGARADNPDLCPHPSHSP